MLIVRKTVGFFVLSVFKSQAYFRIMILASINNSPVAAPAIENASETLIAYRNFRGLNNVTLGDLYTFMTTPSGDRDRFVSMLTPTITYRRNRFYTQEY